MSIRNAGLAIREARLKAGLSQEKLSEGICSVLSLSRIENGAAGVSPSTFQALMAHAGANSAIYPVFASRTDFDCFYTLKHVRFYLDCWQLDSAYEELDKIEEMHWADNKFYYQEWLLLHGKLQFRSGCGSHQDILTLFSDALKITRPAIDLSDFRHLLLSVNEIELLITLAQEFLYTNQPVVCLEICSQIFTYLSNCQLTFFEKNRLLSEYAIVYVKYLIAAYDYITAQNIAEQYRHQAVLDNTDSVLHELTFLTALSQYHCGDVVKAKNSFHYVFFSAHSIESCYSTTCRNYILQNLFNTFPDILPNISILPLKKYHEKKAINITFRGDIYDFSSTTVYQFGDLIRDLRTEQKISQSILCHGLCSKSKLSKIENNTLMPEIILAETLLQRLGLTEDVFTFFGSNHEIELHDLKVKAARTKYKEKETNLSYIDAMQQLMNPKDTLYNQYVIFKRALYISDPDKSLEQFWTALHISLPDFSIHHMHEYRLSWLELTILNSIGSSYSANEPSNEILYYYKILEYLDIHHINILAKRKIYTITLNKLLCRLDNQKRFVEIVGLRSLLTSSLMRYRTYILGICYSYFSQALGQCKNLEEMPLFFHYSFSNLMLHEATESALLTQKYIEEDCEIDLNHN